MLLTTVGHHYHTNEHYVMLGHRFSWTITNCVVFTSWQVRDRVNINSLREWRSSAIRKRGGGEHCVNMYISDQCREDTRQAARELRKQYIWDPAKWWSPRAMITCRATRANLPSWKSGCHPYSSGNNTQRMLPTMVENPNWLGNKVLSEKYIPRNGWSIIDGNWNLPNRSNASLVLCHLYVTVHNPKA